MNRYWLSFADGSLPKGTQFLGAVVVDDESFLAAVFKTHTLGINPGGEVAGGPLDNPEKYDDVMDRLLTKAEAQEAATR